jgi:hypothetical protein
MFACPWLLAPSIYESDAAFAKLNQCFVMISASVARPGMAKIQSRP